MIFFFHVSDQILVLSETVGFCSFSTERKGSGEDKLDTILN